MFWGRLADKIGLRPCLIAGTMGSAVAFVAFGLSANFSQAVLARAMAGLLNGNAGVLKSHIGRVTDATNQAKGLTLLSIAWGVGSFIAPIIGGVLCRPADTWPDTFEGTVFDDKPFLLPCAVVAAWGIVASFFLLACLDEPPVSDDNHQPETTAYSKVSNSTVELVPTEDVESPVKTSRFKKLLELRKDHVSNIRPNVHGSEYRTVQNPLDDVDNNDRYVRSSSIENDDRRCSKDTPIVVSVEQPKTMCNIISMTLAPIRLMNRQIRTPVKVRLAYGRAISSLLARPTACLR